MIPSGVRIFVCTEPVDMRRGFDRLAQTAKDVVGLDPSKAERSWCSRIGARRGSRFSGSSARATACCTGASIVRCSDLPLADAGTTSVHIDAAALAKLLAGRAKDDKRAPHAPK